MSSNVSFWDLLTLKFEGENISADQEIGFWRSSLICIFISVLELVVSTLSIFYTGVFSLTFCTYSCALANLPMLLCLSLLPFYAFDTKVCFINGLNPKVFVWLPIICLNNFSSSYFYWSTLNCPMLCKRRVDWFAEEPWGLVMVTACLEPVGVLTLGFGLEAAKSWARGSISSAWRLLLPFFFLLTPPLIRLSIS